MIKIDEIRQQTDAELVTLLDEVKDELFRLNLQQSLGQLEKPSRIRQLRRQVARFETVKSERRSGAVAPGSAEARSAEAVKTATATATATKPTPATPATPEPAPATATPAAEPQTEPEV